MKKEDFRIHLQKVKVLLSLQFKRSTKGQTAENGILVLL